MSMSHGECWTGISGHPMWRPGPRPAAVVLVALLNAGSAAAAVCSVPSGPYPTIQAAVDDIGCQTVQVAAGTYTENVAIGRSVFLLGAQAGIDARARSGADESIIDGNAAVTIDAPNVFVDGFTITGPTSNSSGSGIIVKGSGAVIRNNILDGITGVTTTAKAISVYRGPDGVVIAQNVISNVSSPSSAKGVFIEDSASTDPSIAVTIEDNEISGVTSANKGAYGVLINNGNGNTANAYLTIRNNRISGLSGAWVHGVGLEADTPEVVVTGNSFSDFTSPGADKIAVWFESVNTSFSTAQVNDNNFNFSSASSVYGIAVGLVGGTPLDGTRNYWGSPTGPSGVAHGRGALVSDLVTYAPWSRRPGEGSPCPDTQHPSHGRWR